jgi:hypothetical protein
MGARSRALYPSLPEHFLLLYKMHGHDTNGNGSFFDLYSPACPDFQVE